MREAGGHFDDGVEDEVDHQRNAAPVAVGHQSKDERAHGTERQRERDGESNLFVGAVKLFGDRGQAEDDQEEVEGVERPAEEAGEDCRAMTVCGRLNGCRNSSCRNS